jgi:hypothetical protein
MYDAVMLIFAGVAALAAVIMCLPLFGVDLRGMAKWNVYRENGKHATPHARWWMLAMAALALILSSINTYRCLTTQPEIHRVVSNTSVNFG